MLRTFKYAVNITHLIISSKFANSLRSLLFIFSLVVSSDVMAVSNLLDSAETLINGTTFLTKFFWAACIFTGIYLLTAGLVNYKEHRNNPKLIPLSTVIVYFILGLAVIGVPFLNRLFGSDAYDTAVQGK